MYPDGFIARSYTTGFGLIVEKFYSQLGHKIAENFSSTLQNQPLRDGSKQWRKSFMRYPSVCQTETAETLSVIKS
jgi:hypothetical protein